MGLWQRLFGSTLEVERPPFHDEVLGELTYDDDEDLWRAAPPGLTFVFSIGPGEGATPPPALLAHARDITRDAAELRDRVASFLRAEAASHDEKDVGWGDEIRSLVLSSVDLFWPDRPDDGMLYFSMNGEDDADGRVWRCDYIGRTPVGLAFDS